MQSVRLGGDLEGKLERASGVAGLSKSALIRQAVAKECDLILGETIYDQIRDLIGSVRGRGDSSMMSDEQIAEEMAADAELHRRVGKPRS